MILISLGQSLLNKVPKIIGMTVSFLLFITLRYIDEGTLNFFGYRYLKLPENWYESGKLFFLGFPNRYFFSSDYYPVIPWLFLYLTGYFFFAFIKDRKNTWYLYVKVPGLSYVGRHTFIIYLLHQPVIYGILYLTKFI